MSRVMKIILRAVAAAVLVCQSPTQGAELAATLEQIGRAESGVSAEQLAWRIRSASEEEVRAHLPLMLGILGKGANGQAVEAALAEVAVRHADQPGARVILETVANIELIKVNRFGMRLLRFYSLVRLSRPKWSAWFGESEAAYSLIASSFQDPECGPDSLLAAQAALRKFSGPAELQRQLVMLMVRRNAASELNAERSLLCLTEREIQELRVLVRESGADVDTFHFGAASALVHLGDEAIIPDLAARRTSFAAFDKKFGVWIDDQIKMIRSQHPPEKLLDLIRNLDADRPDFGRDLATRAVERASQVLPIADVRQAALQRSESVQARLNQTTDKTTRRILESGMRRLREVGVRVQVLTEEDMLEFKPDPRFAKIGHSEWPDFE